MRHYQTDIVTSRTQTFDNQTTQNIRHLMLSNSLLHHASTPDHSKDANKLKTQVVNREDDLGGRDTTA